MFKPIAHLLVADNLIPTVRDLRAYRDDINRTFHPLFIKLSDGQTLSRHELKLARRLGHELLKHNKMLKDKQAS